jgi:hypothetical protein
LSLPAQSLNTRSKGMRAGLRRTLWPNSSAEFRLDSLSIPREESEDMLWEIWFSCNKSEDWLFTVHMRNWHPTGRISVMH